MIPDTVSRTTLYDRLTGPTGSDAVFAVVTTRLYDRVLADDQLRPYFAGIDRAGLERHMTAFLVQATGGPRTYSGRGMAAAHAGLGVTDAAYTRVVDHVAATLRDAGVPEAWIGEVADLVEPLRSAVVSRAA